MPIYTKEKQFKLIEKDWRNLELIDNQYEDVCIEAIKQDGYALEYVKEQTPKLCLAAVKENGYVLEYVKEQTPEICLEAVKQTGYALQYVKEQTEEICIEAVKEDSCAIKYVKEETPKICFFAFLNYNSVYQIFNFEDKIDNLIKNNFKIEHNTFCITDYKNSIDKNYSYFNMNSFLFMKDLLIHKNINNRYIFKDTIDIELLKEIALSNNELILVDEGNIKDIHRKLANRIITIEYLQKETF